MSYNSNEDETEEAFEHTLLVVREVSAYKIPPRSSSGGYKCGEWLQSDKIWSGRLRVVSIGESCEIRLEDSNTGDLFAACHVDPGKRDVCVEPATDSSRYFVLRIDDGHGRHAFIGLGFTERNEAFDFNVALSDHAKHALLRNQNSEHGESSQNQSLSEPSLDLRLKEGETIRINVKTKGSAGSSNTGESKSHVNSGSSITSVGRMKAPLAPPPGGGRLRSPLPPPPNDTKPLRVIRSNPSTESSEVSKPHNVKVQEGSQWSSAPRNDAFADFSQLETSLRSSVKSGDSSNHSSATGWAAF